MKKNIFFLIVFTVCLCNQVFAQQHTEKYSRIKILLNGKSMAEIAALGLAVDHGEYIKGSSFTTDLSATEISVLKQEHISYEVLIEDVILYYIQQSNAQQNDDKKTRAVNCTAAPTFVTPSNFNFGSMGGYFTYQQVLDHLDSLASKFPALVKPRAQIDTFKSIQNRQMYWMKISDNPNVDENEPEVLMTALHHAREPLGVSQLIFFMYYLCENYNTNSEVKYFVDNAEIYFVPIVNPDGYVYNQTNNPNGGGMWRKNRRANANGTFGVDLNRNYGHFWGYDNVGSSPTPSSDTYRGTAGFSEPETRAVKYLCEQHQFRLALNYHTYGNLIVYPWGYTDSNTPDSAQYHTYTKAMTNANRFVYGTGTETVGYTTNGDSDDWMHGETNTKNKILSITPEVGTNAHGFWPPQAAIIPYCNQTMEANMNFMRCALAYADCDDIGSRFITPVSASAKYMLFNKGMSNTATFTVSIIPVSNNISAGSPKVYNSPPFLTIVTDSIPLNVVFGTQHGDEIKYVLRIHNGTVNYDDTVTKIFATYTQTELSSNCNTLSGWTATGAWGNSTQYYTSPTASLTESPAGNYANNVNSTIRTTLPVNLTLATKANLKFRIKWDSECNLDYLQVKVSNNNGASYNSICTRYAMKSVAAAIAGQPAYDGVQWAWQYDEANLDAFTGQNILLRFDFVSDGGLTKNGFFLDDVQIETIQTLGFPLAFTMSKISLQNVACDVKVLWSTNQEQNIDYFVVERSGADGIFEKAGIVNAHGSQDGYEFLDASTNGNHYQYRVKAVNLAREEILSNTQSITLACEAQDIKVYPNPATDETHILLKSANKQLFQIKITDIFGNKIYQQSVVVQNESKLIDINSSEWATGQYMVIVHNGKENKVLRLVKK
jgi:hypothetical protein